MVEIFRQPILLALLLLACEFEGLLLICQHAMRYRPRLGTL